MNKTSVFLWLSFIVLLFGAAVGPAGAEAADVSASSAEPYEIYPLPQRQSYRGTAFVLTDEVNLVIEDSIDQPARDALQRILESKQLAGTESPSPVPHKTNILIGIRNSNGIVDQYFHNHVDYDASVFNEIDAYVLDLNSENHGTIAILGADADAAYYALATLRLIVEQAADKTLQSVLIEDFADTRYRGFIEGFYGFPWSHEDRISLMEFGGQWKMNTYIFAPKDDPYHNRQWRTLYPADELEKIKELVETGERTKTKFVWAIHPGFSMINWDQYETELQTLLNKLEQLYSAGVRQFGLFMDDISTSQALNDKDRHVMLITDVAEWAASKGDVKPLIYCPPFYNQAWTGAAGRPYLEALRNVPENVEIMWTGRSVVNTVNTQDMQWPKDAHGRDPYVWLNWPVNDYRDARLMLGKGEVLIPGTHNIAGVVSNPMGHAELSKIALFAVADYTWNVDDFNADASWLASFKYIEPDAAEELNTIAYHLSDPSPSGHGLVLGESENIRPQLEQFLSRFAGEALDEAESGALIAEFDQILNAIEGFKTKTKNAKMLAEITPWLNSLKWVALADKYAVQSAMALQKGDYNEAWERLAKASNALAESKTFKIPKLNYPDVTVEAGAKRLVPFAQTLVQQLDARIYAAIDPGSIVLVPMTSYGSPADIRNMTDGDLSTYMYVQIQQENGDWYGLDLGKIVKVTDIEIIQGRNDNDHDIFQRGILEYSANGHNWTAIGGERSGFRVAEEGLDIEARYIRYRLTHAGIPGGKPDLWTAVREFAVNASKKRPRVYTNVPELEQTAVNSSAVSAEIGGLFGVTLQPSQYIGLHWPEIEELAAVASQHNGTGLTLESSVNGVVWERIGTEGPYPPAAYVRLVNHTDSTVTFNLNKLTATFNKFAEPVITHNYSGLYSGSLNQLFDGKWEDKVWFGSPQTAGSYVQIDLGGVVNVHNAAIVIQDGEGDYFRQGDLQLSLDGQNWITIHTFNHPWDRSLNFPDHEVPYRIKRVVLEESIPARYVRLISTASFSEWLALNEIVINEGMPRPGKRRSALIAQPEGADGRESVNAADQSLSTFYTPSGPSQPGSLSYLFKDTELNGVIILQSPDAISNAQVSVRDMNGWHPAGALSKPLNIIDTSSYDHVLELKLTWDGTVKPAIYEIVPLKRQGSEAPPQDEPHAVLDAPSAVPAGKAFQVRLDLNGLAEAAYALDIVLEYDAGALEYVSANSLEEGVRILDVRTDDPGSVRLIMFSEGADRAMIGDIHLLNLTFRAKMSGQDAKGWVEVKRLTAGGASGDETEAAPSSVSIRIQAAPKGGPGDVNEDGKVSIGDLAMAAAHYGKDANSPDWEQARHADVNSDGKIDILDLAAIARAIVQAGNEA